MLIDKLKKQVDALELDLKGRTVLTEAATGPYIVTPVLAGLAGAKVFAYSRTTRYGTLEEVFARTRELTAGFKDFSLDIQYIDSLEPEYINAADIITNSGHLRPLNESMLKHAKDGVVIPLMYEAWEWREADMDINYIRKRGFPVAATNERHPEIDVFNYLGDMALKQIFDAGINPYRNKFVLLCNNDFGPYIAKVMARICERLAVIDLEENKSKYSLDQIDWIGGFPEFKIPSDYKDAEAIIFTAYPFDRNWIGRNTPIKPDQITSSIQDPLILRYCGDIDEKYLTEKNMRFFPAHVHSGHMGILPSAVGYDPIIRLQSGGLKAGELMLKGKTDFKNQKILDII
jgi:hypothetical protein